MVHQFNQQQGSCPGPWPVKPLSLNRPETDEWRNTTNSHHGRESEQQSCRFVEPDIAGAAPVAPANFRKYLYRVEFEDWRSVPWKHGKVSETLTCPTNSKPS